jgi:NAD(P)-dependent dehydrogenase (short-subunit alcohol dehydrogenase family)
MKNIIMTGGTSGLGEIAAHAIGQAANTRLIIGARRSAAGKVETIPLDLTRLSSVRAFAQAVIERLGDAEIDGLVLNAGTQFPTSDHRTTDSRQLSGSTFLRIICCCACCFRSSPTMRLLS